MIGKFPIVVWFFPIVAPWGTNLAHSKTNHGWLFPIVIGAFPIVTVTWLGFPQGPRWLGFRWLGFSNRDWFFPNRDRDVIWFINELLLKHKFSSCIFSAPTLSKVHWQIAHRAQSNQLKCWIQCKGKSFGEIPWSIESFWQEDTRRNPKGSLLVKWFSL